MNAYCVHHYSCPAGTASAADTHTVPVNTNATVTCTQSASGFPASFTVVMMATAGSADCPASNATTILATTYLPKPPTVMLRAFTPPAQCGTARKVNLTYSVASSGSSGIVSVSAYTPAVGVQCNATRQQGK